MVRDQGARLTFSALRHAVDRVAAGLIALGLKPGDRVGLWSPNRIEWVLTQYATAKAGLILVNINPAYRAAELEYALNKVECRALITADRFKTTDYIGILRELAPELADCAPGELRSARLPHLTTVAHFGDSDEPGYYRFADIQALSGAAEERAWLNCPDCCSRMTRSISSSPPAPPDRRRRRPSRIMGC